MSKITKVFGYEVIDSRGMPTVKAEVIIDDNFKGQAYAPSGASTGMFEAVELRDNDKTRFMGKGVLNAVSNINSIIAPKLCALKAHNQQTVDMTMLELDATTNKSKLGANAILAVSLAYGKAVAQSKKIEFYEYIGGISAKKMPVPLMNILNGGAHAHNNIDIQEFMIAPHGFASFKDAIKAGCEIYAALKVILKENGFSATVGDEGGFAPDLKSDEEAIEIIINAISKAGYSTENVKIALDIASSEWYKNEKYHLPKRNITYSTDEMINYLENLTKKYPIFSIEDGLSETDYEGWKKLTCTLNNQLVGDDLFVTDSKKLKYGYDNKIANAILIKPNQIGTLSETLKTIQLAQEYDYKYIISHRSGETEDTSISDIAAGTNAPQIKMGAPCRSERVSKYNRLIEIETKRAML